MNNFFSPGNKFLFSLTLVAAILALLSYAINNLDETASSDYEATISVDGEGEVLTVPDVGQFSFSVNAKGETAVEAQEASGIAINNILAYLREQGIEDKDIKTQNYRLNPRTRYQPYLCKPGGDCPPGGQYVDDGYEVTQTVSVKVHETDGAGAIIAGVGERGATNISSLAFTVDDTETLRNQAREIAIQDAKEKAETLAEQLGVDLTRIVSFYEGENYYQPVYEERSLAMDASEGFGGAELPMGEESTKVTVNITYEIE